LVEELPIAPLILFLDDMQNYDLFSFKCLIKILKYKVKDILIIAGTRLDYMELPLFDVPNTSSQAQVVFEKGLPGVLDTI
jgi:hypothetical protein